MTTPKGRNLSDEDVNRIAAAITEDLRKDLLPAKPLHEMSDVERTQYANETWLAAGVVPIRPTVTAAVDWSAHETPSVLPKPRGYDPMRGETPPGGAK